MNKKVWRRQLTLLLLLLLVGALSSCNSFLEHRPYSGGESGELFWSNPDNVRDAVDGLNRFTSEEGITGRGFLWFENCSDNLITGRAQAEAAQIKNFQMAADNGRDADENWSTMYGIIAQANEIIRNVKDSESLSQEVKDFALGNAYFYRGFAYLWLAPWYGDHEANGGIPIVTEETALAEYDQERPSSVLENYRFIIEDMDRAASLLPLLSEQRSADYGRPWKAAAWAMATRAALHASTYDATFLQEVLEYSQKIMALTGADKRALHPDYTTLFTVENNFSSEYIFSFLGSGTQAAGPKFHGISFQNGGWGHMNTWGYFQPTLELWEAYEEGDTRRGATLARPGDVVRFVGHDIHLGVNPKEMSSLSALTFTKWLDPYREESDKNVNFLHNKNYMANTLAMVVARYSDILLMRAEALIWTRGEGDPEAKQILNAIRKRAGLPEDSQATKAELKQERRCELAFEFCTPRFLDLLRWKDYHLLEQPLHGYNLAHFQATGELQKVEVWPRRHFDPMKNHNFPIPAHDINKSKHLKQNRGY